MWVKMQKTSTFVTFHICQIWSPSVNSSQLLPYFQIFDHSLNMESLRRGIVFDLFTHKPTATSPSVQPILASQRRRRHHRKMFGPLELHGWRIGTREAESPRFMWRLTTMHKRFSSYSRFRWWRILLHATELSIGWLDTAAQSKVRPVSIMTWRQLFTITFFWRKRSQHEEQHERSSIFVLSCKAKHFLTFEVQKHKKN